MRKLSNKTARGRRVIRHLRVRQRVMGTPEVPRLSVFRSLKGIYSQVIDDREGKTLAAASSLDEEIRNSRSGRAKTELSRLVGNLIARRARDKGITRVVFDRGGYKYHGRVKALADGAREGGLKF